MSVRKTEGSLDLGQLRTFLAVYRTGTLSGAARSLGIAQATASAQLAALERQLGSPLFLRRARGMRPTPAAEEVVARVAEPLDRLQAATDALVGRSTPELPRAAVRLGGPAEFLATAALPVLTPLVTEGVRLHATHGLADELLDAVGSGHLDVALSTVRPRGRRLRAEPLYDESFVLVASAALARDLGAVGSAEDLAEAPLVAYAADLPILRRYWRHVFGVRLEREPAITVPDLRAVHRILLAGVGVSVLPRYLCQQDIDAGRLVALRHPEDEPINTLFLVTRDAAPHGDLARVIATLRSALTSPR